MTKGFTKFVKTEPKTMETVISNYIREMKLVSGLNERRIFAAWDAVSGAAMYTVGRYVKGGVLYCNISSSVVRNQLFFQREQLVRKVNDFLQNDELFVKDDPRTGYIKSIILK